MERQELIDRIKKLPQDRVAEVAEFVESLAQRERNDSRAHLRQALSDYAIEHAGTIADAAGLSKDSVALCHQVTTLDRAKLTRRIGELNSTELSQVEDGIKAAMDLP